MTGQRGGRNGPSHAPTSPDVRPGALAVLWATFAALCLLLALGTANDMRIGYPGLVLGGAVLGGSLSGLLLTLRRPSGPWSRWETMSRRTRLSLSLGIGLSGWALVRAAEGVWDELAVLLCVWLVGAICAVVQTVRWLLPVLLGFRKSRART